jgi:phage nucleotide-binding protein
LVLLVARKVDENTEGIKRMKIQTSIDIKNKPLYMLVYGTSGRGKTSLIKTLPLEHTLVLDAENGLAVLQNEKHVNNVALHKDDKGITLNEEDRYQRFLQFCELIKKPETKAAYTWLVIDSLTELGQNIQRHMATKHEGFKLWGEYTNAMIDVLKFFRDLDHYNVLFLALEDRIDEEETGRSYSYPSIGGKKAKEFLLPCFDEVYRLIITEDKQRMLVTTETPKTQAKSRLGGLNELEPANLSEIIKKLKGDKKK